MDEITFNNTQSVVDYVERLAIALSSGEAASDLSAVAMFALMRVNTKDLETNQCVYERGVSRWASDLLDKFVYVCQKHGSSAEGLSQSGLDLKDLRCMRALACLEALVKIQLRNKIIRRCGPIGLMESALQAYEQLIDYLKWKSTSRPNLKDKLVRVVGPKPTDVYSRCAEAHGISREEAKALMYKALYSYGYSDSKPNEGDSNMSLGVEISNPNARPVVAPSPHRPFDFSKPAIIDIKHVYGVPVEQLTLQGITSLLSQRQEAVEQLKALPHKPEVIKKQISDLKKDITNLLELANELFPVAE